MSLYSDMAGVALEMLTGLGETATFTRVSGGTFDPATGTTTGATASTFTAKVYPAGFDFGLINGDNIQQGDKRLLMESTSAPAENDVVTLSDGDMTVINYRAVGLTNDVALYVVQLRS